MKTFRTISKRDLSNGIIQNIDNLLAPKNCVKFGLNLRFDKILGRATIREGSNLVGSQIVSGKDILGLYQFNPSDGSHYLLSVSNIADDTSSTLYRLDSGVWTAKQTSLTANAKMRFLTYLDTVMGINGTDKISSTDGETWVTTGGNLDIENCPAGKYLEKFHDRIYVAGVSGNPDRLYYSSIPSSGAISWTSGNGYIDIEPEEGEGSITGLKKVPGYLLIFKERVLKRWNGSSTFPDDLCYIGSPSQESIVYGKNTVFYFSASYKEAIGFYETNGETTRKISRPIQEIIDAIDPNNYSSIAGFSDGSIVMWEIGDITYNDITYPNVVVLYSIPSKSWTILNYPDKYRVFSPYIVSNALDIIAGNNNGEVIELFTGTEDINTSGSHSIPYRLIYHPMELGTRGEIADITRMAIYSLNGAGMRMACKVDEKGDAIPIGNSVDSDFYEQKISLSGHTFEFSFFGQNSGGDLEFIGFDLLTSFKTQNVNK